MRYVKYWWNRLWYGKLYAQVIDKLDKLDKLEYGMGIAHENEPRNQKAR